MNFIIKRVNNRRHTFYTQDKLQEKGYYLTKSLAKIFMDYLAEGIVVDFNLDKEVVIISKNISFLLCVSYKTSKNSMS